MLAVLIEVFPEVLLLVAVATWRIWTAFRTDGPPDGGGGGSDGNSLPPHPRTPKRLPRSTEGRAGHRPEGPRRTPAMMPQR